MTALSMLALSQPWDASDESVCCSFQLDMRRDIDVSLLITITCRVDYSRHGHQRLPTIIRRSPGCPATAVAEKCSSRRTRRPVRALTNSTNFLSYSHLSTSFLLSRSRLMSHDRLHFRRSAIRQSSFESNQGVSQSLQGVCKSRLSQSATLPNVLPFHAPDTVSYSSFSAEVAVPTDRPPRYDAVKQRPNASLLQIHPHVRSV